MLPTDRAGALPAYAGEIPPGFFSDAELSLLLDEKLCYPTREEEQRIIADMYREMRASLAASCPSGHYQFLISYDCNLCCSYCFQVHPDGPRLLPIERVQKALAVIREMEAGNPANGGATSDTVPRKLITISGGEPLRYRSDYLAVMAEIIDFCRMWDFDYAVTTNGVELRHFIDFFGGRECRPRVIQVSLDGPPAVHDSRRRRSNGDGTFAEIVAGIGLALNKGLAVDVRINLDANNVGSLPSLMVFFQERGWLDDPCFHTHAAPVDHMANPAGGFSTTGRTVDLLRSVLAFCGDNPSYGETIEWRHFRSFSFVRAGIDGGGESLARFWPCEAAMGQMVFDPEGVIYPCFVAAGDPAETIGDYFPTLRLDGTRWRRWTNIDALAHPLCSGCRFTFICCGGCPYLYIHTGRVRCPDWRSELSIAWEYFLDQARKRDDVERLFDGRRFNHTKRRNR